MKTKQRDFEIIVVVHFGMLERNVPIKVVTRIPNLEAPEARVTLDFSVEVVVATTIALLTLEMAVELMWTGEHQVAAIALDWLHKRVGLLELRNFAVAVFVGSDRCDVTSFTVRLNRRVVDENRLAARFVFLSSDVVEAVVVAFFVVGNLNRRRRSIG